MPLRIKNASGVTIEFRSEFPAVSGISYTVSMRRGSAETLLAYRPLARWGRPSGSLFHRLHRLHDLLHNRSV
jgi:hypothetical protein